MDSAYEAVPLTGYEPVDDETLLVRAAAAYQSLATRRSLRAFSDRPVPRAVIEQCLLAAGTAPSGANHQPWHFACVSSPELKRQIREAAEAE
ncbi:MAG: nitroreductase family protein, partial [Pseudomonadales bacterium]